MYLIKLFLVTNNTSEVNNMHEIISALLFSVQRKASTIRVPSLVPRPEGENLFRVLFFTLSSMLCTTVKEYYDEFPDFCAMVGGYKPESGLDIQSELWIKKLFYKSTTWAQIIPSLFTVKCLEQLYINVQEVFSISKQNLNPYFDQIRITARRLLSLDILS